MPTQNSNSKLQGQKAKIRIGMISLGCPKTLVDSEIILGKLDPDRYELTRSETSCEIALINTCSFIGEARQESVDRILGLIELKKRGKIRAIVVMGCLVQEFPEALKSELAEVDAFIGSGDYQKIPGLLAKVSCGKKSFELGTAGYLPNSAEPRIALMPLYSRYLKISEGCDHLCSFCAIPRFRGKHRSRPVDDVVHEAEILAAQGAKELILTGQDTSDYGKDFSGRSLLPGLLKKLNAVSGLEWIRVMYLYPSGVTDELIDAVASLGRVCKYLDLPLQHASNRMLRAMRRGITQRRTAHLIEKLRKKIPGLAIRTTLIVGFPGETEKDFRELLDFMKSVRFERAGIFKYSREDGTPAAGLPDPVSEKVKAERYKEAMLVQQTLSLENHRRWVGRTLRVLIEQARKGPRPAWTGRSQYDAPEIDGTVTVFSKKKLAPGDIVPVKITQAKEYDLRGRV